MVDSLTVDKLAITINDRSTKAKPYQDVIEFNVSANIQLAAIAILCNFSNFLFNPARTFNTQNLT